MKSFIQHITEAKITEKELTTEARHLLREANIKKIQEIMVTERSVVVTGTSGIMKAGAVVMLDKYACKSLAKSKLFNYMTVRKGANAIDISMGHDALEEKD